MTLLELNESSCFCNYTDELNENVRRILAKKIVRVYETLNKDLQLCSNVINNNLINVKVSLKNDESTLLTTVL
jgi:hypothetical protein